MQKIRVEQQSCSYWCRTIFQAMNTNSLTGSKTYDRFAVEIISGFTIVNSTAGGVFQKQGIEPEVHAMCGLMHRVIKMHYAHQRMPCFKTKIAVISFYGVGLVYFHIKVSFCKGNKNQ